MFPPGEPVVDAYRKLQQRFGGNDICLAVYRDPELWDADGAGLERLEETSQQLAAIDGVEAVLSLAELHGILQKLRDPMRLGALLPGKKPPLLDPDDRLAQAFASVFEGYTHRRDSDYVAIALMLHAEPDTDKPGPIKHQETLTEIASLLEQLPAPMNDGFVTGEPVLVSEGFQMVQRDGWRLGLTSSILLSAILLVCFRSLRWTLIPLAIVHWSLWLTQALLAWIGLELTMISSTLAAIVTVIGVATTMHLMLKFQSERRKGSERRVALEHSFQALLAPIFWACVTDAVGFSALTIAQVGPVRDFGIMMAIGSMVVFLSILVLVPGLALLGKYDTDPRTPKLDLTIRLGLRKLLGSLLPRRKLGLVILGLLLVFGIVGSLRIQVETDFTKNFRADSPIVAGYAIIERELGGAGVWDIMLPAPAKITNEYIEQVLTLEKNLREIEVELDGSTIGLTKVMSIADAAQASQAGALLARLPLSAQLIGMRTTMPEFTSALLTARTDDEGFHWLRVMLRSQEQIHTSKKTALVKAVEQELSSFTGGSDWTNLFADGTPPQAQVAGYHVMLGKLVASVLNDQWICFLAASLGILAAVTVATRSLLLGLASLLPNALPILLVLGVMGWLGHRANMGVAMIAAVSLGLSVDSSIHYLLHYRRRIADGMAPGKALRSAHENVGLAVILATLALIFGFLSLCLSEFTPTVVFGALASLTMLGGLLGNLVMLPLLIAPRR